MANDPNKLPSRDDNVVGAVPVSSSGKGFNYLWLLLLIPLLLIPFCTRHPAAPDNTANAAATPAPAATVASTPGVVPTPLASTTTNPGLAAPNPFLVNTAGPDQGKVVLLFDANATALGGSGLAAINPVVSYLQLNPNARVSLKGYTDSTGTADVNKRLTEQRINSVKSALTGAGVDAGRIATANFGEAYPVTDNTNPAAREMNRRVEVELAK